MSRTATVSDLLDGRHAGWDDAIGWIAGLGCTFTLFFGMAHFENVGIGDPAVDIEDARMVAAPFEPPPPPPVYTTTEPATALEQLPAFAGIDVARSDSPVQIAVVSQEFDGFMPGAQLPPKALVPFTYLHTELKPRAEIEIDSRRVYQISEVDQLPRAVVRVAPTVAAEVFGGKSSLRVVLLIVIDANGRALSTRIAESSGKPAFDAIVAQTVNDRWEFSPAIRRGRSVKCLAQQPFRVSRGGGSPFNVE
jgi:TonB family protein